MGNYWYAKLFQIGSAPLALGLTLRAAVAVGLTLIGFAATGHLKAGVVGGATQCSSHCPMLAPSVAHASPPCRLLCVRSWSAERSVNNSGPRPTRMRRWFCLLHRSRDGSA